jgi:predicted metal-dependent enzyme (double-stranded beta helix superfamily)
MSFSDKNNRVPKVLVFRPASNQAPMLDSAGRATPKPISFLLNGQGVFLFSLQKVVEKKKATILQDGQKIILNLLNEAQNDGLRLELGDNYIRLIRMASGETLLQSITSIELEPQEMILPLKLLRDPIVQAVSLFVKDTAELTMMDIANNRFLPRANLSPIAQKLYDNIAGEKFVINTPDFPQFTQAVEYSIATKDCWCNKVLAAKSTEFGADNPLQTYLRITLGANSGESPGVPYVMEIWPPSHYSPIHNHAGANAIIRVLHGAISVKLFRFLDPKEGYAVQTFSEGDVTWISPDLNQIHQLKNLDGNVETCITIQCYMYDVEDETHYDYFDYLGDDEEVGHFDPDSDADFAEFKAIIQKEWNAHLKDQEDAFLEIKKLA